MEQPLDVFSLNQQQILGKGCGQNPEFPKRNNSIPKNAGSPSVPEGLPKIGFLPARVSKVQEESELWDEVTMATEARIQEY